MPDFSVLHISTADNIGGSGRSAYKIHKGLCRIGIDSKMLVGLQVTSDPTVARISKRWMKVADLITGTITDALGLQYVFLPSSLAILSHPWFKAADIIQLYNTHGNYFSHSILPLISRRKKVVWRLSDMWPVTGHCVYSGDCELWLYGCKKCPHPDSYPPLSWDSASLLWKWKKYLYQRSGIHIVAPSSWTMGIAEKSPLFKKFSKSVIPNGVDLGIFKPIPKESCMTILNIPKEKKTVLFLAHVIKDNPRKGGDFFIAAINKIVEHGEDNLMVLLAGEGADAWGHELKCPVWRHGLINDDELLAVVYNSADILVHPAIVENLPNSIIEAMACGTPSVAFDTGGVSDVVRNMETGYLAACKDGESLYRGIKLLLDKEEVRVSMGKKCREIAEAEYSLELQTRRFAELYQKIVLIK